MDVSGNSNNSTNKINSAIFYGYSEEKNNEKINLSNIQNNNNNNINNINNININNKEINEEFIDYFIKFFEHYYNRASFLLNNKVYIEIPKKDFNDYNLQKQFLMDINNNYEEKNNFEGTYYINETLRKGIMNNIINSNKGKILNDDFQNTMDEFFTLEKYSSGGKKDKIKLNNENLGKSQINFQLMHKNPLPIYEIFFDAINYLKKECKFSQTHFDSKTKFILENNFSKLIEDKEVNNLPYGWIGIGLDVFGLYEKDGDWILKNNEWIDGFIGFSKLINLETKEISSLIPYILLELAFNNENFKEYEKKVDIIDKRDCRIMKKGIYVYSKIKNAENEPVGINIGKNDYLILLNVKVKQNKICEPKNEDIWFLDAEFIRVYRILFKNI